jgi:uncharacterized protein (DUF362 family)
MPEPTVALTRCVDYDRAKVSAAIVRQFELLGGLERFVSRGDSVLLKPNMIAPRSARHAVQTDPAVIIETARLLKDFGARPFVADSPAWGDVFACVSALKMDEELKRLGVGVRQLNRAKWRRVGAKGTKVGISSVATEADVIINLPKFKAHQQLIGTFAVKNMFGCVVGKQKAFWHFARGRHKRDFCELLIEIYRFLAPAVTIVDAVTVMEGMGPIRGKARQLGWLIGGVDPIACEIACSKLVNLEPYEVPIIKTAKAMGFGCGDTEAVNIVGDDFAGDVCTDFEIPPQLPVRFSLPYVLRSVFKQIVLLVKAAIKGTGTKAY